ncbi:MAG: diguanylate cyclase, partial [Pseudomonadota bacterium]
DALGFDEAARPFAARGRVRALDPGTDTDRSMLQAMVAHTRHNFGFCASGAKGDVAVEKGEPDVMLVVIADDENEAGLTQLAELRLADTTRHARLIAVLNDPGTALAGRALDVGADDVMGRAALPEEVDIRINTQLHSKQDEDGLRRRLQNSIEAAITDPLTGLYNRRYALSALGRLIETVTRDGGTLAVMVADLDHFKLVNDTYGHSAGDIALKCVADQLRDTLGSGAIVSRLGGEEFLIVLPKADSHAARLAADLLRLKVRDTDIFVPGRNEPIHVTISIGVTVAQASGRDARPSVEVLLGEADQALYHSKSDGRDTVRFNHSSAA